jgi:hypothetical protein
MTLGELSLALPSLTESVRRGYLLMESLILYAKIPFACRKKFQMLSFIKYSICLGSATIHANTLKWLQISC